MSVSLAVAAKHGHIASSAAYAPLPWNAPEQGDGFELTGMAMHFAADHQIYGEGDEARCFYKVVSGVVRTCRFLSDGRRQIDAFHREGDVFGFEATADHRMAAEAVTDCSVIAYRRRGLETIVSQDDRLSRWFFSHAMTSMASAREHSLLLGRASAAQKIGAFLEETAATRGKRRRHRVGDEPAGHRGLSGAHDRDGVADPVATGPRRRDRAAERSAGRGEGSAGTARAEQLTGLSWLGVQVWPEWVPTVSIRNCVDRPATSTLIRLKACFRRSRRMSSQRPPKTVVTGASLAALRLYCDRSGYSAKL